MTAAPAMALLSACAIFGSHRATPRGDLPVVDPPAAGAATRETANVYRDAGLIVSEQHFPFVAVVHYFAGRTADDSTLTLVALSFASQTLAFSGDGATRHARYDVVLEARVGKHVITRTANRETVEVNSPSEALQATARIVFQRYLRLPPGDATLLIDIRDANGANAATVRTRLAVPRLGGRMLAPPVIAYRVVPRTQRDALPRLVVNPRDAIDAERDSAATIYVEGYGLSTGTRVLATVLDENARIVRQDTVLLTGSIVLGSTTFHVPLASLGAGRFIVTAAVPGLADTVRTPLLVQMAREARTPSAP